MKPINTRRLLLGAIVVWLVVGIGEAVHLPMLDSYTGALRGLGATEPGGVEMAVSSLVILVAAVIMMWAYAVARDRYGPGPGTAIRIGLAFGFFTHVLPSFALWSFGTFPLGGALFHSVWGVIEVPVGMLAGAALYREREPAGSPGAVPPAG